MKRIIYIGCLLLIPFTLLTSSCEDLMNVKSDEKLSGDDFWSNGNDADVNAFVLSIYAAFRNGTMVNSAYIVNAGDLRCAPVVPYLTGYDYNYITYLADNNLRELMGSYNDWRSQNIIRWKSLYEVIQAANILLEEVGNVPGLTETQIQGYRSEAIFMRNLTYFFLVRVFGDVPYFTDAYNQEPLPRTNMMQVLQNCLADMQAMLDADPQAAYLPWIQPGTRPGIRANRGAALLLMMHINMWMAGFDTKEKDSYYQKVVSLGNELVNNNGGAYYLLSLNRNVDIFRGGTAETFFEIAQNVNANEVFTTYANFSNLVTYKYQGALVRPRLYYTYEFLKRIFPPDVVDNRREAWFDEDIYQADGTPKQITKFWNPDTYGTMGAYTSNAGNQIVLRYTDALLLYAEALTELGGDETKARELVNMVRNRAGAPEVTAAGNELKDAIYWERVRELIGEGQYYFDLVRTGKIHDRTYCYHPITRSNFNAGAWTWPIHADAFVNNTKMTYNVYWQ